MRIRFVPLFVSAILVVMVVIAQVDAGQALRDWGDRWTELYNLGDFEGVVDLYTEDAIFGNTYGVFEGREAILEFYVQPAPEESAIQLFTTRSRSSVIRRTRWARTWSWRPTARR
jgi:hypothetical protein